MVSHSVPFVPPPMKDLTIDNITENVNAINSRCEDARMRFLFERLTAHLHDFARETRLSTEEWMSAIQFLTDSGKICTDTRQELILLSDIMGLSLLVDSIDHPKPEGSTEGTVLGPFHVTQAEHARHGEQISHDPDGEPMLVVGTVKDTAGNPIVDALVDVWETDSKGFYDVQYQSRAGFDGRAVLKSDCDGQFHFKAIVPVPYPIPDDGPVGKLLKVLKRHCYRPSHMHFKFKKDGYDPLITALYLRGDPYETSDAVFGVKDSLVVDLYRASDFADWAEKYSVTKDTKVMKYDFVLVSDEETAKLREQKSIEVGLALNLDVKLQGGLLIKA